MKGRKELLNPLISVIVPIYNVEKYLIQCLESIINQTFKDLEIICVNDGSTDSSTQILENYQQIHSNIKLINKSNAGYGAAVNLGFSVARGEYLAIVEPDDFIDANMYHDLYKIAVKRQKPDIVKAGYWEYFDDVKGSRTKIQIGLNLTSGAVFRLNEHPEILRIHPSIWSCIYKRDFINDKQIRMVEAPGAGWVDNPFFFESLYKAGNIAWLAKPVYYYRQTNVDASSNLKDCSVPLARLKEIYDFFDKENVQNKQIKLELYKRTCLYLNKIENHPAFCERNLIDARDLLERMDRRLFVKMEKGEIDTYNRFMDCQEKYHPTIIIRLKKKYSGFRFYKILKRVFRGFEFLYKKGPILTCKRIIQKMQINIPIKLPRKKNLRVLFVPSDNNRTSGAFLSMVTLNCLLREKYNVDTFVVLPNPGDGEELLIKNKIPYTVIQSYDWVLPLNKVRDEECLSEIQNKKKNNKRAITLLEKLIKNNNFDLVHINTTYSYVGAEAALKAGIPYIWHLREFLEEDQGKTMWDREQGNKLINKADRIVTISQSLYKKYEQVFDLSKLVCIFNGIDESKFYIPDKMIMTKDTIRFIFVGGFEVYKGHIEFANACVKLYQQGYDFEVWFIGTGKKEVRDQVKSIFNRAGLENKVSYLGYRSDVYNYFKETDISFTCSRAEAFGRTTVEAMLGGNLVIGADSAGTRELINDGKTGLLYQAGDVDDLCSKMKYAIENREQARKLAYAGQMFMHQNMTAEINAKKIYELYQNVMKDRQMGGI